MAYRRGKVIKRAIITALATTELSISKLERIAHISSTTLNTHLDELEDLNIIEISSHEKSSHNGRPYRSVKLTPYGRTLLRT